MDELDGWLRRIIRMCYWKQRRRPRTRIGNLLKLGTSKRHAILTFNTHTNYHPEPVESQILSLAIAESFGQQFRVSCHIHRPLGLYTSKYKGEIIPSTSS
jgi:hypothetical protein